jgi:aarF domain-containing kinase
LFIEYRVVLLDAGLAASLTDSHKSQVNSFFTAVLGWDGVEVGRSILRMSSEQPYVKDRDQFVTEVVDQIGYIHRNLADLRGGQCMADVLEIVRQHQVCVHPSIMVCVVTTMVLEGWQNRLDPDLCMTDHIATMLDRIQYVEKKVRLVLDHLARALSRVDDDVMICDVDVSSI